MNNREQETQAGSEKSKKRITLRRIALFSLAFLSGVYVSKILSARAVTVPHQHREIILKKFRLPDRTPGKPI